MIHCNPLPPINMTYDTAVNNSKSQGKPIKMLFRVITNRFLSRNINMLEQTRKIITYM